MAAQMNQNYLIINESLNVVDNICFWDGNIETWAPPAGYVVLAQATTPTLTWRLNQEQTDYVLEMTMGGANIGFTWNGAECVTNQPKPPAPEGVVSQPTTSGTQEL